MKVNKLLQLINKDPTPPSLKKIKMSKRVTSTVRNHQYHNDFTEYEYQDVQFDDIFDIADELEDNNIEPNKYGEYTTTITAEESDSDKDTIISFDLKLDQDETSYLNYLLTLKKPQRNKLKEEQYEQEELSSQVA